MADQEHLEVLARGVESWNEWRLNNMSIVPDLSGATLKGERLCWADFSGAKLSHVDLSGADLTWAQFIHARLQHANLSRAILLGTHFNEADLSKTDFSGANLQLADLWGAHAYEANLSRADLRGANLQEARLIMTDLSWADLRGANLIRAQLIRSNFYGANLSDCLVFGVSVWGANLERAKQQNLNITLNDEPDVTVDNIEVAQFIYLLLNNQNIRQVIDTLTTKGVLILGRFTPDRKEILDAIRDELRNRNYLPILFDFDIPAGRDVTETVTLLASMSRFIIADLTEPSSIPKELEVIVPTLAVPVQPLLKGLDESTHPYSMFRDYWKYDWVLKVHRYEDRHGLISTLEQDVITPAEHKVFELKKRRADTYR